MEIRTYTKEELRLLYNITRPTLKVWLKPVYEKFPQYRRSQLLPPIVVESVFKLLGKPTIANETD